jgi:hypothetical protein
MHASYRGTGFENTGHNICRLTPQNNSLRLPKVTGVPMPVNDSAGLIEHPNHRIM